MYSITNGRSTPSFAHSKNMLLLSRYGITTQITLTMAVMYGSESNNHYGNHITNLPKRRELQSVLQGRNQGRR